MFEVQSTVFSNPEDHRAWEMAIVSHERKDVVGDSFLYVVEFLVRQVSGAEAKGNAREPHGFERS